METVIDFMMVVSLICVGGLTISIMGNRSWTVVDNWLVASTVNLCFTVCCVLVWSWGY